MQSANATNTASDRAALNAEVGQLAAELNRTAQTTQFNGQNLLDGTFGAASFQVGANANQTITATTANFQTNAYGNYRQGSVVATGSGVGDLNQGSTATTTTSSAVLAATNAIALDTLTINGGLGTASVVVAANSTAKTVAANVNAQTGTTGVTASANTAVDMTGLTVSSSFTLEVTSDNATAVTISFSTGAAANADGLSGAIQAFNNVSSQTGVTAQLNSAGTGITLKNASGNDISFTNTSTLAATTFNLGASGAASPIAVAGASTSGTIEAVATGSLTFDSNTSFGISAGAGSTSAAKTGYLVNTGSNASSLQAVNTVDVSTADAANRTLATVDAAISAVDSQRAKFGALESRFNNTITNLQATSDNLSSSRSRIQDTDFAQETANLSRSQILQQAGTAMVAQANQLPQGVLALLK